MVHTYKIPLSIKLFFVSTLFLLSSNLLFSQKSKKNIRQEQTDKKIEEKAKIKLDSLTHKTLVVKKAGVAPFNTDTLFYVYGTIGSFTPGQRAAAIANRIADLGKDEMFISDSLKVNLKDTLHQVNVMYKDVILIGINDIQAIKMNKSKVEAAKECQQLMVKSIEKYKKDNSWQSILKQVALVLLIIIAEYFVLRLIGFIYIKVKLLIEEQHFKQIKGFSYFIDPEKTESVILSFLKSLKTILVLISLTLCVLAIFNIFPTTKNISDTLLSYVISPLKQAKDKTLGYLPNLFAIIVIFFIFKFIRKFFRSIARRLQNGSIKINGFYPDWALTTYNIISVLLYIFMFIVMFPYLPGSDSPIFQGVSVFMGVLFSLGSTSVVGNAIAGLVITYMRAFKVGDRIKIGDSVGDVIEKTSLVTRLRTPKNELITIPNSNIMTSQTINYTSSATQYGLILHCTIAFGYETPWRQVHELLLEAAAKTPDVLINPKPFILQTALSDFYAEYQLNVYTQKANAMSTIYSELNKNIQDIVHGAGLEMLAPHYYAQRDGNPSTIPPNQFPQPSFSKVDIMNKKKE